MSPARFNWPQHANEASPFFLSLLFCSVIQHRHSRAAVGARMAHSPQSHAISGPFYTAGSGSDSLQSPLLESSAEEVSSSTVPADKLSAGPPAALAPGPLDAPQGRGRSPLGPPANGHSQQRQAPPGGLPVSTSGGGQGALLEDSPSGSPGAGLLASVVILAKTIMGAGMAALPRAFVMLGLLAAGGFLLLIAYMTHWSVEALTLGTLATGELILCEFCAVLGGGGKGSVEALTLGTLATGHMSYPEVVRVLCGKGGSLLLQLSLVFRCAGLLIVYIIITADILAGHEGAPGLVCDLLSADPSGLCGSRPLAAGLVVLLCMAPLVTPKRLASTAITSWLGLGAVTLWVSVTLGLVGVALARGTAHPVYWLPDMAAFGGTAAEVATQIVAVIPVLATAYTCQMTVHIICRDLKPFSERRVSIMSAAATALCTVMFLSVAVGSQIAFGQDIPADVLTQFNAAKLEEFVGPGLARLLYLAVRLSFLLSIITIGPMQMAPYRESLSRLLTGTEISGPPYYLITYCSLALFYFVAMHAGSIWVPIQFVGATAGALIAFIFPSWVALAALRRRDPTALAAQRYWRWNAWGLAFLGVVQAVAGVTACLFLQNKNGGKDGGGGNSLRLPYLF